MNIDEKIKEILDEIINQVSENEEIESFIGNTVLVEELIEEESNKNSELLNKTLREINLDEFIQNPHQRPNRPGTRSQKDIVHTQLVPAKRGKLTKKMSPPSIVLTISEALNIIPKYSGDTEVYPFINICEKVLESVDADHVPLLTKMIQASKLINRAFNVVRYREITCWEEIKKILLDSFEAPYAASNLQLELTLIKMENGESVTNYNNRVEDIFQKLCNALTAGENAADSDAIRRNAFKQALTSYIRGLNSNLQFKVETKNPLTLEIAMQVAIAAEKEILTNQALNELSNMSVRPNERINRNINRNNFNNNYYNRGNRTNFMNNNNNNFAPNNRNNYQNIQPRTNNNFGNMQHRYNGINNNNNNNNPPQCYNCQKIGHIARDCRSRPPRNNYNNFTRPPTNYNNESSPLTCSFCQRIGHNIETCYTKRNHELRNANVSGNDGAPIVNDALRPVHHITSQ